MLEYRGVRDPGEFEIGLGVYKTGKGVRECEGRGDEFAWGISCLR
jgi:hypothetical protein